MKVAAIVALALVGLIFVAGAVGAFLRTPDPRQYDYLHGPTPPARRVLKFAWFSLIVPVLALLLFLLACGFVGWMIRGAY
jgi:hypothetical protein